MVPSGPFAVIVRRPTVTVTPFGIATVTLSRRLSSVDIRDDLPPDLQLAGLRVVHHALVGREDQEAEVLGRQEPGFVRLELAAPHGEPRLDDAAGVDPARQRDVVLPAATVRDEG